MDKIKLIELLKSDIVAFNATVENLTDVNLKKADLRYTNLEGANLTNANLKGADLKGANLKNVNLTDANLKGVNLTNANLTNINLKGADLTDADLKGADLDYSSMPLWCGDLRAHYDDKQIIQQLYHVLSHIKYSNNASNEIRELLNEVNLKWGNKFHRSDECVNL